MSAWVRVWPTDRKCPRNSPARRAIDPVTGNISQRSFRNRWNQFSIRAFGFQLSPKCISSMVTTLSPNGGATSAAHCWTAGAGRGRQSSPTMFVSTRIKNLRQTGSCGPGVCRFRVGSSPPCKFHGFRNWPVRAAWAWNTSASERVDSSRRRFWAVSSKSGLTTAATRRSRLNIFWGSVPDRLTTSENRCFASPIPHVSIMDIMDRHLSSCQPGHRMAVLG